MNETTEDWEILEALKDIAYNTARIAKVLESLETNTARIAKVLESLENWGLTVDVHRGEIER